MPKSDGIELIITRIIFSSQENERMALQTVGINWCVEIFTRTKTFINSLFLSLRENPLPSLFYFF